MRNGRVAPRRSAEHGQATVEFALILPLVVLLLLCCIDVVVIGRDAVRVQHASREAARTLAVSGSVDEARTAALHTFGRGDATITVANAPIGHDVDVEIRAPLAAHLTVLGRLRPDVAVSSRTVMRREGDPDLPP